MDDLERKLESLALAGPSRDLDRRVDAAFVTARRRTMGPRRAPRWFWPVAVGIAAVGVIVVLHETWRERRSATASAVFVQRIEPEGALREMLLGASATRENLHDFVVHVDSR